MTRRNPLTAAVLLVLSVVGGASFGTGLQTSAEGSPDTTAPASTDGAAVPPESTSDSDGTAAPPESMSDEEWQQIVDAANEEGQLTYYTISPPSVNERLQQAFSDAYPEIALEMVRIPSAEMEPALETERETGADGADVVSSVNYRWIFERDAEGWFADLIGPAVAAPEYEESGYLIDGRILAAPVGLLVLAWNTNLVEDGIDGYDDLLDPRLGGGAIGVVSAESPVFSDFWTFLEEEHVANFVEEFAVQDPVVYPSTVPLQESLAAGEIAVAGAASASDIIAMQEGGAPVDYVVPDPAWAVPNMFYTVEWSKHPNAAQVFMNFVASPEGQLALNLHGYSPLTEVAPQTLGGNSQIVLTNVERTLEPGWAEEFFARWSELYES